jgi:hypothetical protein
MDTQEVIVSKAQTPDSFFQDDFFYAYVLMGFRSL